MRKWIGRWACLVLVALPAAAAAQDESPEFEALLQDKDEVLRRQKDMAEKGDEKAFTVITDSNIDELEVGAEYKSQGSFFRVTEILSKGTKGGRFVVQRVRGKNDPGRKWERVAGRGPISITSRETLLDWFFGGGGAVGAVIMGSIAALLLALIVIVINSLFIYRSGRQAPPRLIDAVRGALDRRDVAGFGEVARSQGGLLAGVCRAMLADPDATRVDDLRTLAQTETDRQVSVLRIPLRALNLISVVAPLLGLFGTVWGLMVCFESVAEEAASASKSQAMADGIRIALRTTFAGLAVAILARLIYFIFSQVLNTIVGRARGMAVEMAHKLAAVRAGAAAPTAEAKPAAKRRAKPPAASERGAEAPAVEA